MRGRAKQRHAKARSPRQNPARATPMRDAHMVLARMAVRAALSQQAPPRAPACTNYA
jgi:hypothetical protein